MKGKINTRALKYNRHLDILTRRPARFLLKKYLNLHIEKTGLDAIHGPYIFVANHSTVVDPVLYHDLIYRELHYVVSDTQFRNPFMRLLLKQTGCISKKKNQRDNQTMKEMFYVLHEKKEPIGIFPEGFNTWDGTSQKIIKGTAGLIKISKLPVIYAKAHGAYLTFPRWAHKLRRGRINLQFRVLFTAEQLSTMKRDEIYKQLCEALSYNEFESQKANPIAFPSPKRAEYIERVLFCCPFCKQMQKLYSHNQYFSCLSCDTRWFMDIYGFFHKDNSTASFTSNITVDRNLAFWNRWQGNYLKKTLLRFKDEDIIFIDDECQLRYGKTRLCMSLGLGKVRLTKKYLYFLPYETTHSEYKILLSEMQGLNVQNNEKIEWTNNKLVFQLNPKNKRINTYKYMIAIEIIQNAAFSKHRK